MLINKFVVPLREEGTASGWDAGGRFAKAQAHFGAVLLCLCISVSHLLNVVGLWYSANKDRMKGSGEPAC